LSIKSKTLFFHGHLKQQGEEEAEEIQGVKKSRSSGDLAMQAKKQFMPGRDRCIRLVAAT